MPVCLVGTRPVSQARRATAALFHCEKREQKLVLLPCVVEEDCSERCLLLVAQALSG